MIITAEDIKFELMRYYLYERQFLCITTEQNMYYGRADIWVLDRDYMGIEIEIKVSKADLISELNSIKHIVGELSGVRGAKYIKHERYIKYANAPEYSKNLLPNRFYFCVPEHLQETAITCLRHTPYGLLVCIADQSRIIATKVVKSGKLIHRTAVAPKLVKETIRRINFENIELKKRLRNYNNNLT